MIQKNTLRIADFLPQAVPFPLLFPLICPSGAQKKPTLQSQMVFTDLSAVKLGGGPSLLPSSFLPRLPSHFHSLVFASYRIIFHSSGGRFYSFK